MREPETIRQDVMSLASLAQQRDKRGRTELYQTIFQLMEQESRGLSDTEKELMCDILRRLTHEVDVEVRKRLATNLAGQPDATHDLILLLANDDIEIAHPFLTQCPVLTDKDLIEIVYHKTRQHQMSIAARRMLSEPVSHALVTAGNEPVIVALLNNHTARINEKDFSNLVVRSEQVQDFQKPLLSRSDLPASLARKMYAWVSDSLKQMITESFGPPPEALGKALDHAVADLARADAEEAAKKPQAQTLIDKLHSAGQLKVSFIIKSLCQGEIELFELGFAKIINLKAEVMRKILYGRGIDGLAIACRAIGIDRSVFLTIFKLTRQAYRLPANIAQEEMARAFSLFESMDQRKAEITVHRWAAEESRAPIF